MDPLSVSASIFGLIAAAVQVSSVLKTFIDSAKTASNSAQGVLTEVADIGVYLKQLHAFLSGTQEVARSRTSLIMIEQVIIVLTDCVSVFAELEQTLEMLKTQQPMQVIDRVKWAMKESTISKLLRRLQASKTSLSLMLTTLTCASMDEAHTSVRDLTSLVQQVLKSSIDMSRRLRNLERMHPALAPSISPSHETRQVVDRNEVQGTRPKTFYGFSFEKDLQTSRVYRRAALIESKVLSVSSSNGSNGISYLSGLSLSDVSNVCAIALPISPYELWNHHRYAHESDAVTDVSGASTFDAWYNPPAKKSAFIRTAYFNGQYTNQYSQSKSTGHLIYRRFVITGPHCAPAFIEGAAMAQRHKKLALETAERRMDEGRVDPGIEHTSPHHDQSSGSASQSPEKTLSTKRMWIGALSNMDNSQGWTNGVLELLKQVSY